MLSIHDLLSDVASAYTDLRLAYRPAMGEAESAIARFGLAKAMGREARAVLKVAQATEPKPEPKPAPVARGAGKGKAAQAEPAKG